MDKGRRGGEALTDSGRSLGPVERADDHKSESLALLAVDDDITGLRVGRRAALRGGVPGAGVGRGKASVVGVSPRGEVAARGAVLGGDGAGAAAVLWTALTCRGRRRDEEAPLQHNSYQWTKTGPVFLEGRGYLNAIPLLSSHGQVADNHRYKEVMTQNP